MKSESDEQGQPLPPKHHLYASDNLPRPEYSTPGSRRGSEPMQDQSQRSKTPDLRYNGPAYAALPNHSDDIRRLIEECIAAKESARVLTEALVFTRPEDLPSKPIIKVRGFYGIRSWRLTIRNSIENASWPMNH